MKALILNSGIGRRMGELTLNSCKCMAELEEGVTILDSQITSLLSFGVKNFCITTGPFADELEDYILTRYPQGNFDFVHNPKYVSTNYIYSIYLAREVVEDDIILLHGDLVFEPGVLKSIIDSESSSMVIDTCAPLPEKDFKAVTENGAIVKVGIEFFQNAYAAQPLYKLKKADWIPWLREISRFCVEGNTGVYAENAFNEISHKIRLIPLDVKGKFCGEIDNPQDLERVKAAYKAFSSK